MINSRIKNKFKYAMWIVPIALVLFFAISYFSVTSSELFEVTKENVKSEKGIYEKFGVINEISLSPFNYKINLRGSDSGSAWFNLSLKGNIKNGTIKAYMKKSGGTWSLDRHEVLNIENF